VIEDHVLGDAELAHEVAGCELTLDGQLVRGLREPELARRGVLRLDRCRVLGERLGLLAGLRCDERDGAPWRE
jgi:hypothetical protein